MHAAPGNTNHLVHGMADIAIRDEDAPAQAPASKPRLGKKRLLMIAPVVLLLLGSGGYAAIKFGHFGEHEPAKEEAPPPVQQYFDLPEMIVNLSATDRQARFLKLKVALEADDPKAIEALKPVMPRVLDMFQTYLRELRSTDLEGSAGLYRLKDELMRRINLEIQPLKVTRVLFKEIIVQ